MALGADTPTIPTVGSPPGSGSSFLAGIGGFFSGGSLLGGLGGLGDHSSATGAPQNATGWGTFNNPFIIATGGSKVDNTSDQRSDQSLDTKQGGPSANTGAPLVSGDGLGSMTLLGIGLIALVALKAVMKKGAK